MCRRLARYVSKSLVALLVGFIRLYQCCISPLLGARCRFFPGCSMYTRDAVEQHGFFMGSWLALKRLTKCHPLHPGGFDPVPSKKEKVV